MTMSDAVTASSRMHLVDENGDFCTTPSDVSQWLHSIGMLQKRAEYFVVGIMGAQSSGKSTLLNMLFGTEFDMLDASKGRQMTTKGVWLGSSPLVKGALVMDLEGTDSVSRGSDRHPFERQSALLGLSVAEVLIINMWQHDIGRYVASNYGVLSTVFEVNLELLQEQLKDDQQRIKTMLMFCIRDHNESESPLNIISTQLTNDTKRIWSELKKPDGLDSLSVDDVFDIKFIALPHKRYEEEKFAAEVTSLRNRFLNPSVNDFLLGESYHLQKSASVPTDGLGMFLSTIWQTIRTHKDLNLPSQKEMLAIYRCDELVQEASAKFSESLSFLRDRVASGFDTNFARDFQHLIDDAVTKFESDSDGYHIETVERKCNELNERLLDDVRALFVTQMQHARVTALNEFRCAVNETLPTDESASACFAESISAARRKARDKLEALYEQSVIDLTRNKFTIQSSLEQLESSLDDAIEHIEVSQLAALQNDCCRLIRKRLLAPCQTIFEAADSDMWMKISLAFESWWQIIMADVLTQKLPGFCLDSVAEAKLYSTIASVAVRELEEECNKQARFVKMKMQKVFDQRFRYDESSLPRKWSQEKNIRAVYVTARDEAITLLNLFEEIVVEETLETAASFPYLQTLHSKRLISVSKIDIQKKDFLQECMQALRGAETSQAREFDLARTPMWVFPLVSILGFNEFMSVISSPFLLIGLILIGVTALSIYYLNLVGPVLAMTRLVMKEITSSIYAILDSWKEPIVPPRPFPSSLNATDSITSNSQQPASSNEIDEAQESHRRSESSDAQ